MKILQTFIYGREPRTAILKQKAHLFTLLAILWFAFSLIAVIFLPSRDHGADLGWFVVLGIWAVHLIWMVLAAYFWVTEKPKRVLMPNTDGDGVDLA